MNFEFRLSAAEGLTPQLITDPSENERLIQVTTTSVSPRQVALTAIFESVSNSDRLRSSSPINSVAFVVKPNPLEPVI